MKYETKEEFLSNIRETWNRLQEYIKTLSGKDMTQPGVWAGDWTIKDLLAHLHEWHVMTLRWYAEGLTGIPNIPSKQFPNWGLTPQLNRYIRDLYKDEPLNEILKKITSSHKKTIRLIQSLTDEELLKPGYFAWCGKTKTLPLASYFRSNTVTHYTWAEKILRRWVKKQEK